MQKVKSPATGRTEALALVTDYLSAHPNGLDAVWVGWDDAALGASQAVTEAGSTAKVTGCDATSEALAQIQSGGAFLATVNQPWPEILDTVTKDLTAFQKDGTLPSENFQAVDVTVVDAANASTITPSDKLGSSSPTPHQRPGPGQAPRPRPLLLPTPSGRHNHAPARQGRSDHRWRQRHRAGDRPEVRP